MEDKETILYNYLYNKIIKSKYYCLLNWNAQTLADDTYLKPSEIGNALSTLSKHGQINYTNPAHIISLPYPLSKLDEAHHQLVPGFKYDPKDIVRKCFITMVIDDISYIDPDSKMYQINGSHHPEPSMCKLADNIYDTLADKYFQSVGNVVNNGMLVKNGSLGVSLTYRDEEPQLSLHFQFSYQNYHSNYPHVDFPISNGTEFYLLGQNGPDIERKIERLKKVFRQ